MNQPSGQMARDMVHAALEAARVGRAEEAESEFVGLYGRDVSGVALQLLEKLSKRRRHRR